MPYAALNPDAWLPAPMLHLSDPDLNTKKKDDYFFFSCGKRAMDEPVPQVSIMIIHSLRSSL